MSKNDLSDRLRNIAGRNMSLLGDLEHNDLIASADRLTALEADNARLRALAEELAGALGPFANLADLFSHERVVEVCTPHPDNPSRHIEPLDTGELRRARAALASYRAAKEAGQ